MKRANGYRSLQILFFALLSGQTLFLLTAFLMIQQKMFIAEMHHRENIMLVVLIILCLFCMISGNKIFKKRVQQLGEIYPLTSRFNEYRSASLVRWALLEGCCLFAIVCFMLTSNYLFVLIALLLLFIFGSNAPAKNKVASDMGITTDELDSIS